MEITKILLIGNSSCVNRGDAAILDGIISGIEGLQKGNFEITATSVQNLESEILLKRPLIEDFSYDFESSLFKKNSILNKIWYKYLLFYEILFLAYSVKFSRSHIPKKFKRISDQINEFDVVIQVGGSYFVDLYTPLKYVSLAISIILKKPVYLAGHSVGPFNSWKSKLLPRILFKKVNKIYLREEESLKYIKELNIPDTNVVVNTDTAMLIAENTPNLIFREEVKSEKPLIAITVRNLKPFDKRLNVSQDQYELLYSKVLDILIAKGYHIVGVSMGTGFGNYPHDDRIAAYRIKRLLKSQEEMTVLNYEYDHLQVGYALSQCEILIGTRLHSVILSLRYNTPALAIYYEHKSLGILKKMDLEENSFFIKDIGNKLFMEKLDSILSNLEYNKMLIKEGVSRERNIGVKMLEEILG